MYMYQPWLKKTLLGGLLITILWAFGFIGFLVKIHHLHISQEPAEAIVILTGGKGRIQAGLDLLEKSPQSKALISGAGRHTHLEEISPHPNLHDQITLGYEAQSTKENAQETKQWAKDFQDLKSLKIVTSHYHMPRSLLELKMALPHVHLIPYPVVSSTFQPFFWWLNPYNLKLLFIEYNKYLLVWITMPFRGLTSE